MPASVIAVCGFLVSLLLSPCFADKIVFKNGTEKNVRIYKTASDYLSYLADGKIEVVARDKIKEIKVEGEPLTEKELAEALQKSREILEQKVADEEKKSGVKPAPQPKVKPVVNAKQPGKGVKIIENTHSDTKTTELMIDPFPAHPVKDKPAPKAEPKPAKK